MISQSERNWILTLRSRLATRRYADGVDLIVAAVRTIESEHRNQIWRFAEYVHFVVDAIRTRSKFITNLSIGVYQLKINMILDYFGKSYILSRKRISLHANSQQDLVRLVLRNRNNGKILRSYIERNFSGCLVKF